MVWGPSGLGMWLGLLVSLSPSLWPFPSGEWALKLGWSTGFLLLGERRWTGRPRGVGLRKRNLSWTPGARMSKCVLCVSDSRGRPSVPASHSGRLISRTARETGAEGAAGLQHKVREGCECPGGRFGRVQDKHHIHGKLRASENELPEKHSSELSVG